jgi:hypothetical protein
VIVDFGTNGNPSVLPPAELADPIMRRLVRDER